jgi:outer membrane protein assembly factor BamE
MFRGSMRWIALTVVLLAGCGGTVLPSLKPYKIDIQQGNFVTQEMVAKLKPGMTRSQVRFVLGSPLVVDIFRTNRWDYVYTFQKAGTLTEQRQIAVIFEGDKLARIEGDIKAAGTVPVVPAKDEAQAAAAPAGALPEKSTLPPANGPARNEPPPQ